MADRVIFLDRDGTVCDEVGYVNHEERLRLLPRSVEALCLARAAAFRLVVVTNQAGVARGYFTEEIVGRTHRRLERLLEEQGAHLDGIYYCPHHPEAGCACRKPRPGMLLRARDELDLSLEGSYMIGDHPKDLEAGAAVGLVPLLVLTGYGRGEFEYHARDWTVQPAFVAEDLLDAVRWILCQARSGGKAEG